MCEIMITSNDAGQRLDRFLRKYLPGASLGEIYRIIRKDAKVNGRRAAESYMLSEGDTLSLYLSDEAFTKARGSAGPGDSAGAHPGSRSGRSSGGTSKARRTFRIVYEDDAVLIANKPYGLLTHGDSHEKKNHLANQVKDYLIETGAYDPRSEKVFSPAPVNRLDRNTTGLVLFGKTAGSVRELTRMIREDEIRKFYFTIACGIIENEMQLKGSLARDESGNRSLVTGSRDSAIPGENSTLRAGAMAGDAKAGSAATGAKHIETIVRPLEHLSFGDGLAATLCEVELVTGRTHQIRAHLASAGHPLAGDVKYAAEGPGKREALRLNRYVKERFGLTSQLLHAGRIGFSDTASESDVLSHLAGRTFDAPLPGRFAEIYRGLGGKNKSFTPAEKRR